MPVLIRRRIGNEWVDVRFAETPADIPADPEPDPDPILFGSSAGPGVDFTDWNALLANDGSKAGAANNGFAAFRSYTSGDFPATFAASPAAADAAAGIASVWSCKPDLAAVAAGTLDSEITAFFNSIPAGHRFFGMAWHEPWDNMDGGEFTAEEFRNAQVKIWNLLQASDADTELVKWGILLTAWDFQPAQDRHEQFFPASGEYDFVGVDGYDHYVPPGDPGHTSGSWNPGEQLFGPCVDFAAGVGKPVLVGEFSFHPDPAYPSGPLSSDGVPSRPHRLQAMVDYFAAQGVVAALLWHSATAVTPWWMDSFHNWTDVYDHSDTDEATLTKVRDLLATHGKQSAPEPPAPALLPFILPHRLRS